MTQAEETIRNNILGAADRIKIVVVGEAVTEPGAAPGTTRPLVEEWSSATVEVGKKYRIAYTYLSGPESKGWAGLTDATESIV